MKILIRIPTVQYGFFEAEGTEKDIPKMLELQNKYGEPLEEKKEQLLCSTCGEPLVRSKAGNLYCPNSLPGRGAGTPHQAKDQLDPKMQEFKNNLK